MISATDYLHNQKQNFDDKPDLIVTFVKNENNGNIRRFKIVPEKKDSIDFLTGLKTQHFTTVFRIAHRPALYLPIWQ